MLGCRYTRQPYCSLVLLQRSPSPPTSACPCPRGLCSARPQLLESPLLSPPRSFLPFPASLGRDGRATLPVLSGSCLPPPSPFGPPRWDSTACT